MSYSYPPAELSAESTGPNRIFDVEAATNVSDMDILSIYGTRVFDTVGISARMVLICCGWARKKLVAHIDTTDQCSRGSVLYFHLARQLGGGGLVFTAAINMGKYTMFQNGGNESNSASKASYAAAPHCSA